MVVARDFAGRQMKRGEGGIRVGEGRY